MMRNFLLCLALLCASFNMNAQKRTIDIVGNNGSVQHIDWDNISHIEFNSDDSFVLKSVDGSNTSYSEGINAMVFSCEPDDEFASPVGEWEFVSINGMTEWDNTISDLLPGDKIQICSNGRVYDKVDEFAVWKKGGPYALSDSEDYLVYFKIKIWELNDEWFNFDIELLGQTANVLLRRVSNADRTDNPFKFDDDDPHNPVIDDDSDFSPCLNWGSSMEDVENYMKQFNWIKDYEDKWSVAYSNTGKTKGINYTFFQEKLEMVFYTFNYSEENLVKSIQEIKDKYGVTLEETVSFEDNDVMYKFEGEAIVNNEKCVINISTNKKRIIMISYYVIKE